MTGNQPATFPTRCLYYNMNMADSGAKELISRILEGDLEAYGALVQEHQRAVYNVCLRVLGNRQEAEDLAQEAFLRAHRQLTKFDPERPFGPWMRTLAANLCYNHLKKSRPLKVPLEDETERLRDEPGREPEEFLEISQAQRELYRALWELPEQQRIALELRHFQGLSYQEMAAVLKIPLNTVRSHLYRGRQKLAELLEGKYHE